MAMHEMSAEQATELIISRLTVPVTVKQANGLSDIATQLLSKIDLSNPAHLAMIGGGLGAGGGALSSLMSSNEEKRKNWLRNALMGGGLGAIGGGLGSMAANKWQEFNAPSARDNQLRQEREQVEKDKAVNTPEAHAAAGPPTPLPTPSANAEGIEGGRQVPAGYLERLLGKVDATDNVITPAEHLKALSTRFNPETGSLPEGMEGVADIGSQALTNMPYRSAAGAIGGGFAGGKAYDAASALNKRHGRDKALAEFLQNPKNVSSVGGTGQKDVISTLEKPLVLPDGSKTTVRQQMANSGGTGLLEKLFGTRAKSVIKAPAAPTTSPTTTTPAASATPAVSPATPAASPAASATPAVSPATPAASPASSAATDTPIRLSPDAENAGSVEYKKVMGEYYRDVNNKVPGLPPIEKIRAIAEQHRIAANERVRAREAAKPTAPTPAAAPTPSAAPTPTGTPAVPAASNMNIDDMPESDSILTPAGIGQRLPRNKAPGNPVTKTQKSPRVRTHFGGMAKDIIPAQHMKTLYNATHNARLAATPTGKRLGRGAAQGLGALTGFGLAALGPRKLNNMQPVIDMP